MNPNRGTARLWDRVRISQHWETAAARTWNKERGEVVRVGPGDMVRIRLDEAGQFMVINRFNLITEGQLAQRVVERRRGR